MRRKDWIVTTAACIRSSLREAVKKAIALVNNGVKKRERKWYFSIDQTIVNHQGITAVRSFSRQTNAEYGTNVVAEQTPGKEGQSVAGIPVFIQSKMRARTERTRL
jgi:hypothetical protein